MDIMLLMNGLNVPSVSLGGWILEPLDPKTCPACTTCQIGATTAIWVVGLCGDDMVAQAIPESQQCAVSGDGVCV